MKPRTMTMTRWLPGVRGLFAVLFVVSTLSVARLAVAQDTRQEAHGARGGEGAGHESARAGEAEGEGEHGHAGHHGPADLNWTDLSDKQRPAIIALLVNFGIMAALYYALGKKPITAGLKQRRVTIGKEIEEARKMLDEAKERAKKYQADLKNADTDAATAKTALIAAGKGEVERLVLESEERGERMTRDAERLVEQEKKQVAYDIQLETVNLAITHAHKLLERSATAEDHARLSNELLAELQRRPGAARSMAPPPAPRAPSTGGAS